MRLHQQLCIDSPEVIVERAFNLRSLVVAALMIELAAAGTFSYAAVTESHTDGTQAHTAGSDSEAKNKELEDRLDAARARLEEAAHEVAELSSELGRPLIDRMMSFHGEGPPRAVIGVQLDPQSGKGGARIIEVSPGGPADEAGIRVGDVITGINGEDVKGDDTARQVIRLMRKLEPEAKVKVRVTRNGKSQDFTVTARRAMSFLGMREPLERPLPPLPPHGSAPGSVFGPVFFAGPLGEMELATLTPQLGRYFGTDKGVLVVRAPKDFKLEDGDVILAIDGRVPTSGSHATRILTSYQPGEKITIKLMRQQKTLTVDATLPTRAPLEGPGRAGPGHGGPGHRDDNWERPAPEGPRAEGPAPDGASGRKGQMLPHGPGDAAT